ncbi:LysM peptidoglycan-binding domain-containing protein [Paenibacillus sp. R14(2021)]|uniref:LysM peptidoglycan-binding domain-containing protein n=1 Tax=Paenibacillus sp. R14(2021) TaxID=2859228 RepID=UPI002157E41A|nr:LysM peptidoglycan-binding domain-containing protein [Paenibacillus sp. R14(2021)]
MKIHIVKKGDTLYLIAQKYNVSQEEILQLNPTITNPDQIEIGMKIKVPASNGGNMEIMHQHVVQQGDTLWKLSKAWGVPLGDMIKANPQLKNPNVLLTGEIVNVPKPSSPSSMPDMNDGQGHHEGGGHHKLHPTSVMQSVHGLMGKMSTAPLPLIPGKKPTGPKANTAPVPTPMPMPEFELPVEEEIPAPEPTPVPTPLPAPAPEVVQKPAAVVEKKYPVHQHTYEQNIDLFIQYGVPATEVMSLHDMPSPVHSGYGFSQPTAVSPVHSGYGYSQPTAVSPAMTGDYGMPTAVSPAMTGGYGMPTAVSPAMTGGYGMPTAVSPAMTGGYGMPTAVSPAMTGGYGMPTAVSPAMAGDYGMPTAVSPAMTGGYGMPTAVSPAMTGGGYGYPQTNPTAVSPAESTAGLPWGAPNYGWGSPMVSPISDEDCGPDWVSPESMGPMGGYGYNPSMVSPESMGPMGGYGYNPSMVSPESMGPMGGYGYNPSMVSPESMGPMGGYGYNPSMVSPESMGPMGGYGYNPSMVSPESMGPMGGYGYNPSMVSPANVGPQFSYGYMGNGQVSPVSTAAMPGKKPCKCGCQDKREDEEEVQEDEESFELPEPSKAAAPRKPVKKVVVRQTRTVKQKRRGSLPWING